MDYAKVFKGAPKGNKNAAGKRGKLPDKASIGAAAVRSLISEKRYPTQGVIALPSTVKRGPNKGKAGNIPVYGARPATKSELEMALGL